MERAKQWSLNKLQATLSNDDEYPTIYDLLSDKASAETETATISFTSEEDWLLEYDAWGFRLTLWDETHACRYDTVVEWLEIELS